MIHSLKSKNHPCLSVFACGLLFLCVVCFVWSNNSPQKVAAENSDGEIENAIYVRQEFFGARAIVPLPTAQARENMAKIAERLPDNPQILEKLAEFNEKLLQFDEAENNLKRLAEIDPARLENLAAFYGRRGQFEKEAATLKEILFSVAPEKRAAAFERLLAAARKHDLKQYLQTAFYSEVAKENPNLYSIFGGLIDNLTEEKKYAEALNFLRQAKTQFPERQNILLAKEIGILLETNDLREAERVYQAAFDPFWRDAEAQKFYDFLNEHDRLRAYGAEIKTRFQRNPADFDAAIRLALYRNHDFSYGNDGVAPIILRLEQAKKNWTTAELVTISRLLLQENEAESASRFLYTLYLREDFKTDSKLRGKILYQLFEMFSDAEIERLPLTNGDLRFYEDVARADSNPGILTGIMSLIFSDTNPREKLDEQETKANKLFNRAAAGRVFEEYKREFPIAPELAQMYLDIVRLYAAAKEPEIAEKTLNEFAERYENSSDYPAAALKLADAFVAMGKEEKACAVYQKLLDYFGRQKKPLAPEKIERIDFAGELNQNSVRAVANRNDGINIPSADDKPKADNYYNEKPAIFRDYLGRKDSEITYREVLERFVASLVQEKKTPEILALYSNEIAKYPDEEWLYQERLTQLESTNLTAEQLEIYKTALARFQTNDWRDKLARFFVRNKRNEEFAAFSEDLVGKSNDAEVRDYLSEFVDGKVAANDFEKGLYFKLYQLAHRRFPHNIAFVSGLLRFYKVNKQESEWRRLSAEYYFESKEIRAAFLDDLAGTNRLRDYLASSKPNENTIYELFRADASARLSDFENSVAAYRKLNRLYPNTPEFTARLINFTRSFGQKNRESLGEAATVAAAEADFLPSSTEYRTRGGEIYAEMGDYANARGQWRQIIETARGEREIYLDAATVYWDYFQYDDALRTINDLRVKFADDTLFAFETGAILEAKRDETAAMGEYVKALGANRDETQKEKALKRLVSLYGREKPSTNEIKSNARPFLNVADAAYSAERAKHKDSSFLSLGYAEFLHEIKQNERAATILNRAINDSGNQDFLESAKTFYQTADNRAGEQIALRRLAETTVNPRQNIGYRLQLTDALAENQERDSAKSVLSELVRRFPTNYGVLIEASDFYQRLGYEYEAVGVLENALPKSRGAYRNRLAQKLAGRLIALDRLAFAERILIDLHRKDAANTEIFGELARVYVRMDKPNEMRKAFAETVAELKKSDEDPREIEMNTADLRTRMIEAFTKLKDYKSAVEQHIEIINREPENEELTENAILYVQRYGGGETLVNYYEKTAAEAFKNYRWNVVLARIYQANNNSEQAVKNYRAAIVNQPEMPELYLAVADIETKRGNYDEALKNIDEVLNISGDEAEYVKKKIEILKKAERFSEVEAETAKLPDEPEQKIIVNRFAEAQKLQVAEQEKARVIYREAFQRLLENPLIDEFKAADVVGYVSSLRAEEPLDEINRRLWNLREKLIAIADQSDSIGAGEARKRLTVLDGALLESIGATARDFGTDEELKNLHEDLRQKTAETSPFDDRHDTISLLQNLSRRIGFGGVEEMILLKKVESNATDLNKQINLRNLVNFYNERGAYQKTFDALEKYGTDDLRMTADAAKTVGNREKELAALRAIYWQRNDKTSVSADEYVAGYLEILHAENADELKSLTRKSSVYQLQLINFLLRRGERELAHAAIENSRFSAAWKVSRHAETSLALREFDETSECYFCSALQFDSIGEMIKQTPDKKRFLTGDDWFRLTREYGEWRFEKKDETIPSSKFLTAMIENQPNAADEQSKLGEFYLEKNQLKPAIEHLQLAIETDNLAVDDREKLTLLGAARFKNGETNLAAEAWARVFEDETIANNTVYFQILQKYGLRRQAREKVAPNIVKFLQTSNADDSEDFQILIRRAAASFDDETEKSAYFQAILRHRPTDVSLAEMLVEENLIAKNEQRQFYELLINRSADSSDYDYAFTAVAQRVWTREDVESVYEQENDYKTDEPENEKYEWQKKYLALVVGERENRKAGEIIAEIERNLKNRYARPAWLRTARIRLDVRENKFDLAAAERFAGIRVADSTTEINAPNVERFNDVRRILQEEHKDAEAIRFGESYFARSLALGQFGAANFAGLSGVFFQKGEAEKALRILRLMIDAGDDTKRETALAEIAAIDEVKARAANAVKVSAAENDSINRSDALKIAAETAFEFGRTNEAIAFRRALLETNPADSANKIELAEILAAAGEKQAAENLFAEIVSDKNAARRERWQARLQSNAELPNADFDSLSQFYSGTIAEKSNQPETAAEFYLNSLIADKDAEVSAQQRLIKSYAVTNKSFAALRLAAADKSAKPDELLEILSATAEKVGEFGRAIEFEKAKSAPNAERISILEKLAGAKNRQATDFRVDSENTRKL